MPLDKKAHSEPIPGYRLLRRLGRGGFGEVWKCEAPGGLFKAIKFVKGPQHALDDDAPADEEWQAIERVKAIRHPFLLSMDRVERVGGELVVVMELADRSLADRLDKCRRRGLPGVPHDELIGYLLEAAEALDLMNFRHGLQHLDVKPQNLFLVCNHVKVADFGLVNRLDRAVFAPGTFTPLYAAPETFRGAISPHCDQYSLAIVYQELLTGSLPYLGKNARQLMLQHTQGEPNLTTLPPGDRPAVARALAKEPQQRHPSCTDFVRALAVGHGGEPPAFRSLPRSERPAPCPTRPEAVTPSAHTGDTAPAFRVPPPAGPALPGHRVLGRVCGGPTQEVWKVEGPGGGVRLAKLVHGLGGDARTEAAAVARLAGLRHPGLLPFEVAERSTGRVVLLCDPTETTLRDRFQECRSQGLPGVPRRELLRHLGTVAEALDDLADHDGVFHLGLNPRAVVLDGGKALLADHGLAHLLWAPAGQDVVQFNGRYAAPELFDRQITRSGDQYSLALVYQEMLTGAHPHSGQARRALARSRSGCLPGLDLLPAGDRAAVARALDWDPEKRWPGCVALIRALDAAAETLGVEGPSEVSPLRQAITELVANAAGHLRQRSDWKAGGRAAAGASYHVRLPEEVVRQKADVCRRQWRGRLARKEPGLYAFTVSKALGFWQRWLGRPAGLSVTLRLALAAGGTDATAEVVPFGCGPEEGAKLVEGVAPLLLESLATAFQVTPDRRGQERVAWPHPLRVRFVLGSNELGEPVACRGKDISLTGMGFYLPPHLPGSRVILTLAGPAQDGALDVPASIVRVRRCGEDGYEVGARFLLEGGEFPPGTAATPAVCGRSGG